MNRIRGDLLSSPFGIAASIRAVPRAQGDALSRPPICRGATSVFCTPASSPRAALHVACATAAMGCAASSHENPSGTRKLSEANLKALLKQQAQGGTTPIIGNLPPSPSSPGARARRRARDSAESFMSGISGISKLSGVSGRSFLFKDTWDAGDGSGRWSRHRPDKHYFSDMTKRFKRREQLTSQKELERKFDTVIDARHERERLELEQSLVAKREQMQQTWVV